MMIKNPACVVFILAAVIISSCENPLEAHLYSPTISLTIDTTEISPDDAFDIGEVSVNIVKEFAVDIRNKGNSDLSLTDAGGIRFEGDHASFFTLKSDISKIISVGETVSSVIVCTATEVVDPLTAQIVIESNDTKASAFTVRITGKAVITADSPDLKEPVPGGSGTIATGSITDSGAALSWTSATDDFSAQSALQYRVYQSGSENIGTYADAQANGTLLKDWTADLTSLSVTGLSSSTTYYFNVMARDAAENVAAYTQTSATTTSAGDTAPPVPGGNGAITAGTVTDNSIEITFTAANDDRTAQTDIEYKIVSSFSDNIKTVAEAETNGTVHRDWDTLTITTPISITISSLIGGTQYYFNVLIRDEAENNAAYTAMTATTTGTAIPPIIKVLQNTTEIANGATFTFPETVDGDGIDEGDDLEAISSEVLFTIENTGEAGDGDLSITSITFSSGDTDDFAFDTGHTSPVDEGSSTAFGILFDPLPQIDIDSNWITDRSVTITIVHSDSNFSPYTFTINADANEPSIMGYVTDGLGNPIKGAAVRLYNAAGSVDKYFISKDEGYYAFFDIPTGAYNLVARRNGYTIFSQEVTIP